MKITQLYSETQGNLPNVGQVEVGQLWINAADSLIGTKKVDGSLVQYSQFSRQEKEKALNSIPKAGVVSDLSLSQSAQQTSNNAVTIDDNSDLVIEATLEQGTPFTVTASPTTGHKNTKMVFTKPSGVTSSIVWQGIDLWVGGEVPQFGDTQEAHSMAIAVFSSPNNTVANIIYNTEHPVGVSGGGSASWGDIEGTLANQQDLQNALNAKADASTLNHYAPLANPALTGTATLNGQNLATVNQIPDVSQFVTESTLSDYVTNEMVEAEFSSYDKNIKVYIESELENYAPLSNAVFKTRPTVSGTNVALATDLNDYLPISGGTVQGNLSVTGALSGNTLNATSDKRLKNILNQVQNVDLSEVHAYSYQFKDDVKKQIHIGLIAQDVQKVIPEAVHSVDENGHLGIEYNALVAILVDKVTRLEKRMAELEKKL